MPNALLFWVRGCNHGLVLARAHQRRRVASAGDGRVGRDLPRACSARIDLPERRGHRTGGEEGAIAGKRQPGEAHVLVGVGVQRELDARDLVALRIDAPEHWEHVARDEGRPGGIERQVGQAAVLFGENDPLGEDDAAQPAAVCIVVNRNHLKVERSEEHTSELQSLAYLVCRLLLEKKKKQKNSTETEIKKTSVT